MGPLMEKGKSAGGSGLMGKPFSWVILIHMVHIILYYGGFPGLTENLLCVAVYYSHR